MIFLGVYEVNDAMLDDILHAMRTHACNLGCLIASELAGILGIPPEELMEAMESYAQVESLQQTIYQGEGNTILLIDKLEEKVNQSEQVLNRLFLEEILGKLEGEERELIYQRYFQEKTQSVIAKEMGISQVQVSRMEKRILRKIQEEV